MLKIDPYLTPYTKGNLNIKAKSVELLEEK